MPDSDCEAIAVETSIVRRLAGCECELVLSLLPDWFGKKEANAELVRQAESHLTFLAEMVGQPVGVMSLRDTGYAALEIGLLAVVPEMHLRGIGKMLICEAISEARRLRKEYLLVKTLGPSRPSEHYARTRDFYQHIGFLAVEELTDVWDDDNPCLYMIMPVNTSVPSKAGGHCRPA